MPRIIKKMEYFVWATVHTVDKMLQDMSIAHGEQSNKVIALNNELVED